MRKRIHKLEKALKIQGKNYDHLEEEYNILMKENIHFLMN